MTRRVLKFTQMVKPFKQGVFLCFRRIHRIFKSQFHGPSRLSSLTPEQWVGRHATLRGRCSCLPTRYYYYTIFDTLCQGKNLGAAFPPRLKRRGFHAEEIDDRQWICTECGSHHDRDINAAINIITAGLDANVEQT